MELHEFLHQRQSDASPLVCSTWRSLDAVKPLEQMRHLGFRNPDSGIFDSELRDTVAASRPDRNSSAMSEFQSIREEIEDDFFPHLPVYKRSSSGFFTADIEF